MTRYATTVTITIDTNAALTQPERTSIWQTVVSISPALEAVGAPAATAIEMSMSDSHEVPEPAAASIAYETLSDAIPAATEITFGDPWTHEVPDPEPPTLNEVGQRGRVVEYDGSRYLILGLSATEPVWTVVRPNPERDYGQSDWETDRIDGSATVELVGSWEYVPWVDDAAEYFCIEVDR